MLERSHLRHFENLALFAKFYLVLNTFVYLAALPEHPIPSPVLIFFGLVCGINQKSDG